MGPKVSTIHNNNMTANAAVVYKASKSSKNFAAFKSSMTESGANLGLTDTAFLNRYVHIGDLALKQVIAKATHA